MRAGLAFWAGVLGAIVMVIGMWIAYGAGATGFSFSWWWGAMALGNTSGASWVLGFFIHLVLGGLIGLVYGAFFEAIGRANWALGLLGGFVQLVICGFALYGISLIQPAVPEVIVNPGMFTAYWGAASIATFCLVIMAFGLIVGSMYEPVHKRMRRGAEKSAAELPVGVGQERTKREEYVPPPPKERIPPERPPVKPGKKEEIHVPPTPVEEIPPKRPSVKPGKREEVSVPPAPEEEIPPEHPPTKTDEKR